jgi:hypothetical protein
LSFFNLLLRRWRLCIFRSFSRNGIPVKTPPIPSLLALPYRQSYQAEDLLVAKSDLVAPSSSQIGRQALDGLLYIPRLNFMHLKELAFYPFGFASSKMGLTSFGAHDLPTPSLPKTLGCRLMRL